MPLKAYHKTIAIVVAALLVFRLAITLRTGAIVGDDIGLLFKCFNWWRGGDALSFIIIPSCQLKVKTTIVGTVTAKNRPLTGC